MRIASRVLIFLVIAAVAYGVYSVIAGEDRPAPELAGVEAGEIMVSEASYGLNCQDFQVPDAYQNTVQAGNATQAVAAACNGAMDCTFDIRVEEIGDPANGCAKDFRVRWTCYGQSEEGEAEVPAEAHGQSVRLSCEAAG